VIRAGDGAEIAFEERGSRLPALVFVHGWQADRTVWQSIAEALPSDLHAVAVDLRGSGESRGAPGPYNLERFARDLRELIDALGLDRVVVVGHSMGATVALRLAVDAPHSVRGLVLISPVPASGGGYSPKGEAYLRATVGDPPALRNWLARTFAAEPSGEVLDRLCASALKTANDVALESFESWGYADFAEATRRITVPALVIAPERDVPEVHEQKVAALLPDARYVVLPEAAHYAILEKPHEIAQLIGKFLSSFDFAQDDMGIK
jgi:pimeloyl-ACP methyl ester carboxylesterase